MKVMINLSLLPGETDVIVITGAQGFVQRLDQEHGAAVLDLDAGETFTVTSVAQHEANVAKADADAQAAETRERELVAREAAVQEKEAATVKK